jgi:imidazolonepropionase-like amidohydrolase
MNEKVYTNLQYWDGTSSELSSGDLTVAGELFSDTSGSVEEQDLSGLFAIPGLIDAHVHLCLNPEIKDPNLQAVPDDETLKSEMRVRTLAMVRAGITTARDLGGGAHLELAIRDEINAGETPGPRLVCSGQPITSEGGHCHFWGGEARNTEEAVTVLERQHEKGVDLIKIMVTGGNITPGSKPVDSQFQDETVAEVVRVAGSHGYHVAAHCHGTDGIRQAAESGVTTVEHCSWVGKEGWGKSFDQNVVATLARNSVWVSPTINYGWRRFKQPEFIEMVRGNYAKMKTAGVRLIASTDAGIPNVFHHDLPKALPVFAGFAELSPVAALKTATSDCAQAIGLGQVTGRIAPGFSADFVCYEGNPLEDLEVLANPVLVVARGQEIDPG